MSSMANTELDGARRGMKKDSRQDQEGGQNDPELVSRFKSRIASLFSKPLVCIELPASMPGASATPLSHSRLAEGCSSFRWARLKGDFKLASESAPDAVREAAEIGAKDVRLKVARIEMVGDVENLDANLSLILLPQERYGESAGEL